MTDHEKWIFECYVKMCDIFNIKDIVDLRIRKLKGNMGLHHREKWLQVAISNPKKKSKRYKIYSESSWRNSGISLDKHLVKESYIDHAEKDRLLT